MKVRTYSYSMCMAAEANFVHFNVVTLTSLFHNYTYSYIARYLVKINLH